MKWHEEYMRCDNCEGRGFIYYMGSDKECRICQGEGFLPTEWDQEVML